MIATGEPNRVHLATATRASVGPTWLSISVRHVPKSECGSTATGRSTSATPTAPTAFDFIFAQVAVPPFIGIATRRSVESQWVRSTRRHFHRPATRSGRSRSIRGLAYRRGWNTISRADHRLYESRAQLFDHHEQHLEIGLSQNLFEIISEDTRTDSFVAQRLDSLFMNQSISRISV